jgi:Kef-type K+ transport system membrane component KefB
MPRGEVGIIVALIGTKILVDNVPAVSDEMYAIIVMMCIATTIIAPPILSMFYRRKYKTDYVVTDQDKL